MWIRRTSRGRRDLPVSFREVEGIWVGWARGAAFEAVVLGGALVVVCVVFGMVVLLVVLVCVAVGWLVVGSAGGVMGWVVGGWPCVGEAIFEGVGGWL